MNDACNLEKVKSKMKIEFLKAYQDFNELNDSVKSLLPKDDVKRDQCEWFAPKVAPFFFFPKTMYQNGLIKMKLVVMMLQWVLQVLWMILCQMTVFPMRHHVIHP